MDQVLTIEDEYKRKYLKYKKKYIELKQIGANDFYKNNIEAYNLIVYFICTESDLKKIKLLLTSTNANLTTSNAPGMASGRTDANTFFSKLVKYKGLMTINKKKKIIPFKKLDYKNLKTGSMYLPAGMKVWDGEFSNEANEILEYVLEKLEEDEEEVKDKFEEWYNKDIKTNKNKKNHKNQMVVIKSPNSNVREKYKGLYPIEIKTLKLELEEEEE